MTKEQEKELIKLIELVKKENEEADVALMGSTHSFTQMGITEEYWGGAKIMVVDSSCLPASECIYVMPINKPVQLRINMEEPNVPIQLFPDAPPVIAPVRIDFEEKINIK